MDSKRVFLNIGPELNLCEDLVGEGCAHHEGGVTRRAAEVHQPPSRQQNYVTPIGKLIPVHLTKQNKLSLTVQSVL